MIARFEIYHEILQLNPEKDHQRIVYLDGAYEFPWLTTRALEFALFRTYAVPSISALLDKTGEFRKHGQRRYDDTSLIIAEISEHGYDSERGRAAIRRMNQLHGRFNISNEDFLYVLSTFIYVPQVWIQRYGWRRLTENEKQAGYFFWREVGRRMAIKDIPPDTDSFYRFHVDYEREHFRYAPQNERVGEATVQIFLNWFPAPLHPVVREMIYAMLDDPLREAFGFPKASRWLTAYGELSLKLRGKFIRYVMGQRTEPRLLTQMRNPTHPLGYQIEKLGPLDAVGQPEADL